MSDLFKAYKNCFIVKIKEMVNNDSINTHPIWKNILMKVSIMGIVIGIKKYSGRTIYSVDDGTGIIDCSLWHNESIMKDRISELKEKLMFENVAASSKTKSSLLSILNRADRNELDLDNTYVLGDLISILGNIKIIRNSLVLDMKYHNKVNDVNQETVWILENL